MHLTHKKELFKALWGIAALLSAGAVVLFGFVLYIDISSRFGPLNPTAAALSARLPKPLRHGIRAQEPALPEIYAAPAEQQEPETPAETEPAFSVSREPVKTEDPSAIVAGLAGLPVTTAEPAAQKPIPATPAAPAKQPETARPYTGGGEYFIAAPDDDTETAEPDAAALNRKITLFLRAPKARSVSVTGSFSAWKPRIMRKKNNRWETELYLKPGRYQYLFMADGKKLMDPLGPLAGDKGSVLIVN